MTSKIFWFSHSLVNLEHKSERKNREMWYLWWKTVIIMMMTPSSFPRVAFPLRIFALWREAIFDFQFFYPMNFGNDIEVTDKLSLQMSFCMTGKTMERKLPRFSHLDICFSFVLEFFTKLVFHVEMHKFFYAFLQLHIFKILTKILF